LGTPKYQADLFGVPFGTSSTQSINMNSGMTIPLLGSSVARIAGTGFRSIFEHAPLAAARCDPQGMIVEMNRAFEQVVGTNLSGRSPLRISDLVPQQDRDATAALLRELLNCARDSVRMEGSAASGFPNNWTAWRLPVSGEGPMDAVIVAEPNGDVASIENLVQSQRWEAVGRLAGGVVHDFNNLLTGVMLYCDLLLTSMDAGDRRRRYADEMRSAIAQATGLMRQLLAFARPQGIDASALCLNEIAESMHGLLARLIGENITLDLRLDQKLGLVRIDQAQAQQILLNLVLNARDALPEGGRITVESANCKLQPVIGSALPWRDVTSLPCVLLVVGDNGRGMDEKIRARLFEPFFTTKTAGKGTGLGMAIVRRIVNANRGMIHITSEPGRGTRVMVVLPRASQLIHPQFAHTEFSVAGISAAKASSLSGSSTTPLQEIKESLI
jgi:two-component system cell cycle sensor histidine kinase/response regulator CckA